MCTLLEDFGLLRLLVERLGRAPDLATACRSLVDLLLEAHRADGAAYLSIDSLRGLARVEAAAPGTERPRDVPLAALPFRTPLAGQQPIVLQDADGVGWLPSTPSGPDGCVWVVAALRVPDAPAGLLALREPRDAGAVAESRRLLAILAGAEGLHPGTVERGLADLGDDERTQLVGLAGVLSSSPPALADFVANYLHLAAAQRGNALVHREPVELVGLAHDVMDELTHGRTEHGLAVELHGRRVWARADRAQLARALANLVQNAMAYTPDAGHVDVRIAIDAGDAVIVVADSGWGLDPVALERLGTRYARFHPHLGIPGAGLGVAAVRAIVGAHDGRLDVRSTPGVGSAFTLRLPRDA